MGGPSPSRQRPCGPRSSSAFVWGS
jgi:hypothetical protein